jgi:hypothetical protein
MVIGSAPRRRSRGLRGGGFGGGFGGRGGFVNGPRAEGRWREQ